MRRRFDESYVPRAMPIGRRSLLRFIDERPEIHAAGHVGFECIVRRSALEANLQAAVEHGVDQSQDRIGGAERVIQLFVDEVSFRRRESFAEMLPHDRELFGRRALKSVNRLLFVADREDSPVDIPSRARSCRELFRKPTDDFPLHRAYVLRFVDKDVVYAAVETIKHPVRYSGIGQQGQSLQNQVVEVQHCVRALAVFELLQKACSEVVQRDGFFRCGERHAGRSRGRDALHVVVQPQSVRSHRRPGFLSRKLANFRFKRRTCGSAEQHDGFEQSQIFRARLPQIQPCELILGADVGTRAVFELFHQRREQIDIVGSEHSASKTGDGLALGDAEQIQNPLDAVCALEQMPICGDLVDKVRQHGGRGMLRHLVEGPLPDKSDSLKHLVPHAVRFTVFDGFELRRNPGLKRKLSKKRRRERMQRLDLQTAGGLQRVRKKRPSSRQLRRRQHVHVLAEVEQALFQFTVGQHRPFAETLDQPVLHV